MEPRERSDGTHRIHATRPSDLQSILHVPDEVHLLHEGRIHLAGPPRAFVESADPVVRQFIDGRADGPLPVW